MGSTQLPSPLKVEPILSHVVTRGRRRASGTRRPRRNAAGEGRGPGGRPGAAAAAAPTLPASHSLGPRLRSEGPWREGRPCSGVWPLF